MNRPRVPIASLMGFVALCGVGAAALARPSALWASALYTAVVVVLGLAAGLALTRNGSGRSFWTGFIASGGLYFGTAFFWGSRMFNGSPLLLPDLLIHIHANFNGQYSRFAAVTSSALNPIVQALVTLAVGLLGGTVIRLAVGRTDEGRP